MTTLRVGFERAHSSERQSDVLDLVPAHQTREEMTRVDFVTDHDLRSSLDSDLRELESSLQQQNFKAVHVLAGSIVEALLLDHVSNAGLLDREKALKSDLGQLIDLSRTSNVISQRTADLSSVVRSYRNLIHPGRVVRLQEKIDSSTANVARALIDIVAGEIASVRVKTYGFTAEQIATKLERDSSVTDVISHVLNEVSASELERLMLVVLPERLQKWWDNFEAPKHEIESISVCFRKAFGNAPEELKKRVTRQFANVIRTGGDGNIRFYGDAFFRIPDLEYAGPADRELIKAHLLGRFKRAADKEALDRLKGFTAYLDAKSAPEFIDAILRPMLSTGSDITTESATYFLTLETAWLTEPVERAIRERLLGWRDGYEGRKNTNAVAAIDACIKAIEPIPF